MKKIKLLIYVLVLLIIASCMFSACTNAVNVTDGQKDETGKQTTEVEEPVTGPNVFPIVKEKITLKVFYVPHASVVDIPTNKATQWLEEKTNIHIDWIIATSADAGQKRTLMLSSGVDMPDIFLSGIDANTVSLYGGQGVLLQLDDLIDKYGYNCKKVWEQVGDNAKDFCKSYDGHFYYLPRYAISFHGSCDNKMWINKKWLDNLNLKLPTTTDEFYNVLKQFKEKDANGNGDPNDEIPYIASANGWGSQIPRFIMNSFVFASPSQEYRYLDDNEKVYVSYYEDGWREGLRYYRKLYTEGLMDPESFVITDQQVKALSGDPKGNRIGSFTAGAAIVLVAQDNPEIFHYTTVEPLTGPTGLKQVPSTRMTPNPYFVISATTKYPEAAFRWGDALMLDLYDMLINDDYEWMDFVYGPEGEGWRKANPDEVGLNDQPAKYTWLFNWGDNQNIHWYETFHIFMPMYYKDLMSVKPGEGYDLEKVLYDETKEKYDAYRQVRSIPNLVMSEDDARRVGELRSALNSYMSECMAKFITGELDINSDDWDSYIKELEKIGIQEYIEITQKAYDAMVKK